jgi:hypothetical protein
MVEGRLPEGEGTTCRQIGVDERRITHKADQRDQVMYVQETTSLRP